MPDVPAGGLVLDTHVFVWIIEGTHDRLSRKAINTIEAASARGRVMVSPISIWEIGVLESRGRIKLKRPVEEWTRAALRGPGVRLLELSPEILLDSTRLPDTALRDPADRILVASARITGAQLVTCDAEIVEYGGTGHASVMDARHK